MLGIVLNWPLRQIPRSPRRTAQREEVIRALYKAHRPWVPKELNLGNRAVLSEKILSPELTKLLERMRNWSGIV